MMVLPKEVVDRVAWSVSKYQLLNLADHILVAFSGGKDSILLSLVLREMGISFTAVSIDMGYEAGWGDRIVRLGESINVPVTVTRVRHRPIGEHPPLMLAIRRRVEILDSMPADGSAGTPCTHCYSAKALALHRAAIDHGATTVAFGHHMTDACASLIKEALMQIDRHDRQHFAFVRSNFQLLVAELAVEALAFNPQCPGPLATRIADLVYTGKVDTDEPPRQPLVDPMSGTYVVRPLIEVPEPSIANVIEHLGVLPEGSGCGHSAAASLYSPRELVHYQVLRPATPTFSAWAADLVRRGFDPLGNGIVGSRRRRDELLGRGYKTHPSGLGKL